jgi:hypothetical protein
MNVRILYQVLSHVALTVFSAVLLCVGHAGRSCKVRSSKVSAGGGAAVGSQAGRSSQRIGQPGGVAESNAGQCEPEGD